MWIDSHPDMDTGETEYDGYHAMVVSALTGHGDPLVEWLRDTGTSRVAIHFDVDTIDADEVRLGLGYDRGGLTSEQARRVVADIQAEADVVALTIAEYNPRQVMRLLRLLEGMPLLE